MRTVAVLGAGRVARPLIRYFLKRPGIRLLVADLDVRATEPLLAGHGSAEALTLDIKDTARLDELLREAHVAVSLLPHDLHVRVAERAVEHRVPVVTTSYLSEAMRRLDGAARRAGVLLLNEAGFDPGLDHMAAMAAIHEARRQGEQVEALEDAGAGLPAPEAANNPWRYKFSWNPRGVFLAAAKPARYLEGGRAVELAAGGDMFAVYRTCEVEGVGALEVFANGDALPYRELYSLQEAHTLYRGSMRYPGWCETLRALALLGYLDTAPRQWPAGTTYAGMLALMLGEPAGSLRARAAERAGLREADPVMERLAWAGLFDETPLPANPIAPLDALVAALVPRMTYAPGERDLALLRVDLTTRARSGARVRRLRELRVYGEALEESAMARTVSLPAAICARLLLESKVAAAGVQIPVLPEIYEPVLEELAEYGIAFQDSVERPGERDAGSPAEPAGPEGAR